MIALDNRAVLVIQIVVSLVSWSAIALVLVRPLLDPLDARRALRWLLVPQMMRHIGMSLLGTGVAGPGLPADFVSWVATGDLITALTSISAFVMLGGIGLVLATLATLIGAADLLHNLRMGLSINAADHLGAAWPVIAIIVPMMLVAHITAAARLARRETWSQA